MKNISDGWFKNLTALYECHRHRHNAYRNRQVIRACFARMSQCLDHGQVENSEIAETMEITEIAVVQGNYKFSQ